MKLKFGDLVQCRDTHYTAGLGIVGKIGMVAELRRKDLRVLFDADNQSIWLEKSAVNRIVLPPADPPSLLDRLIWLIDAVDGVECELELEDVKTYRCTVVCAGLNLSQLLEIHAYMSPLITTLSLVPRGMHRIGLELIFQRGRE